MQEQKEGPAGEAYKSSPPGDFAPPLGDHQLGLKIFCLLFFIEEYPPAG